MSTQTEQHTARLDIDYPAQLDRVTTAFRLFRILPIAIVAIVLSSTATSTTTVITDTGEVISQVSRDAVIIAWFAIVLTGHQDQRSARAVARRATTKPTCVTPPRRTHEIVFERAPTPHGVCW